MYPTARDRLYETHPELCFYALNGHRPVGESKTTAEGIERRKALLVKEAPDTTTDQSTSDVEKCSK